MAAEDLARKHARQDDVVSKLRLPGTFGPGIDLAKGLADDVEWLSVVAACHYKIQPQINTDLHRSENYLLRAVVRSFLSVLSVFICGSFSFQPKQTLARKLHLFTAHLRGRQLHCFIDFYVAGAAAQIT